MANRYIDDENLNVARGIVVGAESLRVRGYRNPITNSTEETVWEGSASNPTLLESAQQLTVSSTSSSDAGVVILIQGLDANYNRIEELITLTDGNVTTALSYLRVLFVSVADSGGDPLNGDIEVTYLTNEIAFIERSSAEALNASYTIPAGYTGYVVYGEAGTGKGDDVELILYTSGPNKIWVIGHIIEIYQSAYQYKPVYPVAIQEKTDIRIRANTNTANCKASASIELLLIKNPI